MKLNYLTLSGVIAGSMTDPPALAFSTKLTNSDYPSLAYANVYPLTMLLRILVAQIAVLWLCYRYRMLCERRRIMLGETAFGVHLPPPHTGMKILSHTDPGYAAFVRRLNRRALPEAGVRDLVAEIIAQVAAKGDDALVTLTKRFDNAALTPKSLFVTRGGICRREKSRHSRHAGGGQTQSEKHPRLRETRPAQGLVRPRTPRARSSASVSRPSIAWASMCPAARPRSFPPH